MGKKFNNKSVGGVRKGFDNNEFSFHENYGKNLNVLKRFAFGDGKKGPLKGKMIYNLPTEGLVFMVIKSIRANNRKPINTDVYRKMNKIFNKAQDTRNCGERRVLHFMPYNYMMVKHLNCDGEEFMIYCTKTVPTKMNNQSKEKTMQDQIKEIENSLGRMNRITLQDAIEIKKQLLYFKRNRGRVSAEVLKKLMVFIRSEREKVQQLRERENQLRKNITWIEDRKENKLFYDCTNDTEKLHRLCMVATAFKESPGLANAKMVRKVGRLVQDLNLKI